MFRFRKVTSTNLKNWKLFITLATSSFREFLQINLTLSEINFKQKFLYKGGIYHKKGKEENNALLSQ